MAAISLCRMPGTYQSLVGDGFFLHAESRGHLLLGHALSCVLHRHFHILVCLLGTDIHATALGREFSGIISNGVDHKQGKHLVGFHPLLCRKNGELYVLELECHLRMCDDIKEFLQRKTFDMQPQVTLTELNPLGEHGIILIDFLGKFSNVCVSFLSELLILGMIRQSVDFVQHPVNQWCDTIDKGHLCPLLQIDSLAVLHPSLRDLLLLKRLLILLIQQLVSLFVLPLPLL